MQHIAKWIERGLCTGICEDREAGVIRVEGYHWSADIIGIALIGAIGMLEARAVAETAKSENYESIIQRELGVSAEDIAFLRVAHLRWNAAYVGGLIKEGKLREFLAAA